MFRILKLILLLIVFIGCAPKETVNEHSVYNNIQINTLKSESAKYNTPLNNSCSYMLNIYNATEYPLKVLVQEGYKKQVEYSFIKESELKFWDVLENMNFVNFKFVDKKCHTLSKILEESDDKKQNKQFISFKKRIFEEYRNRLSEQAENRLEIHILSGCKKFANAYFRSLINANRDNYRNNLVSQRQYTRCLKSQEYKESNFKGKK